MSRSIENRAAQLLRRHGVTEPPVPVEEIARALNCTLSFEPLDADVSGLLFRDETRRVIGVNSREPRLRQRFTISHEIGHLLLHRGRPLIVEKLLVNTRSTTRNLASPSEEREANQFAAALLMPAEMVHAHAKELIGHDGQISTRFLVQEMARKFQVSRQAMEYRLVNVGVLSPMALEG